MWKNGESIISLTIAADYPLFGTGNGFWEESFTHYRDNSAGSGRYEHAHNDYLEVLVGQGLVGFILLGGTILLIIKAMLSSYRKRREPFEKGMLFGVLVGALAIYVHGIMDFNLQIAGNMLVFVGILASGLTLENKL